MAVVVQCYHCSTILELDDGFRGGVCRCAQCGSLLQVPKASSKETRQARPAAPDAAETRLQRPIAPAEIPLNSPLRERSTHQRPSRPLADERSGLLTRSPLEEAARTAAASSSGLQRTATSPLMERSALRHPGKHHKKKNSNGLFIISILALIVLVLAIGGVVIWAMVRTNPAPATHGAENLTGTANGTVSPSGTPTGTGSSVLGVSAPDVTPANAISADIETKKPNFLGIPLEGKKIILSIDCGNSSQDALSFVTEDAARAMLALQPDQRMLIALWGDKTIKTIPEDGHFVTRDAAAEIREKLQDVYAAGSSDPVASITQSLALGGDQTIIVSAKFGLTNDLVAPILAARKPGQRIDAIKIENIDPDNPFATIAGKADGRFLQLDMDKVQSLVPVQ